MTYHYYVLQVNFFYPNKHAILSDTFHTYFIFPKRYQLFPFLTLGIQRLVLYNIMVSSLGLISPIIMVYQHLIKIFFSDYCLQKGSCGYRSSVLTHFYAQCCTEEIKIIDVILT